MITNVEIRQKARETLGNNIFSRDWLFATLLVFAIMVINTIAGITGIGALLAAGPVGIASAGYFLHLTRNQIKSDNLLDALECVKKDIGGSILLGVVWNLALGIGIFLCFIPAFIFAYLFGMVFFVKADNPEMDMFEAFKESYRLLKGHVWQFFLLRLSFFGWILLGMLCFGVGTYWVSSYMNAADAIFYDELLREDRKNRTLG